LRTVAVHTAVAPSSYLYKYTKGTDSSSVLLREFKTTFPGQQVDKAFKALLDVLINVQVAINSKKNWRPMDLFTRMGMDRVRFGI
jgi:hypothetical protein